ncbi:hypothetical protein [uncultured Thiodictyon sp.]|uniref:hypothetical protein n=1 Tax=uncultured Thiodictyon sp. TaxID=1846217 RepID=UPI0025FC3516|nr:hypothetical protein [uncultured Thiodictyon sp.]
MKNHPVLAFVLGVWLGGSVLMTAVATYNFAGFADLFARNPALAQHAGFDLKDADAKKASLLWVHSAELNRVLFHYWNRTQIVLAALVLVLALRARASWPVIALLGLSLGLVVYVHLVLEPQMEELGRQLDFVSRTPPPPGLATFQQLHQYSVIADGVRLALLSAATLILFFTGPRAARSQ